VSLFSYTKLTTICAIDILASYEKIPDKSVPNTYLHFLHVCHDSYDDTAVMRKSCMDMDFIKHTEDLMLIQLLFYLNALWVSTTVKVVKSIREQWSRTHQWMMIWWIQEQLMPVQNEKLTSVWNPMWINGLVTRGKYEGFPRFGDQDNSTNYKKLNVL